MSNGDEQSPADEIHPLEYRSHVPNSRKAPTKWHVIVGVILTVAGWGFSGLIGWGRVFVYIHAYPPPLSNAPQPSPAASYAVWYLILTMLTVIVFAALPRERRRGFVFGLLIGTALTGLTEGLCFLNM